MSRNLHLGLDWGTSATKMVLRDSDAVGAAMGLGYVLRSADGGVRHPSLVVREGSRLWFGDSAKARLKTADESWFDLKVDVAMRGRAAIKAAEGLCVRDLSALLLAHMLYVARRAARNLPGGHDISLYFKLGVPTGEMNNWYFASEYLQLARAAYYLAGDKGRDPDGITLSEAREVLRAAWADADRRKARTPTTEGVSEAWLRSEAASEMIWPFRSPTIPEGLYTAVDVGAGTTNAGFFKISRNIPQDPQGKLTFYGAACSAPGLNKLIAAALQGDASPELIDSNRGRENDMLARSPAHASRVVPVITEFKKVWFKARQGAWDRYRGTSNWDDLQLMMVGGGSKVDQVRSSFQASPPIQFIRGYRRVPTLGVPPDLLELPAQAGANGQRFRGDATFLLTAYGLSFESHDLPEITLPAGVPPFQRTERRGRSVDPEDLGYSGK